MNIFLFHHIAEKCAKMYGRDHFGNQIKECCQMLCAVLCLNEHGGGVEVKRRSKGKDVKCQVPMLLQEEEAEWKGKIEDFEKEYNAESDAKNNPTYFFYALIDSRHPCTLSIARSKHLFNWVAHLAYNMCLRFKEVTGNEYKGRLLVEYLLQRSLKRDYFQIVKGSNPTIKIKRQSHAYDDYVAFKKVEPIQMVELQYKDLEGNDQKGTCEIALVTTISYEPKYVDQNGIKYKKYDLGLFDMNTDLKHGFRVLVYKEGQGSGGEFTSGNIDIVESYRANFNISKNRLGIYKLKNGKEINKVPNWFRPLKEINSIVKVDGDNQAKFDTIRNYQIGLEWQKTENWQNGEAPIQAVNFLRHKNSGAQYTERRNPESMSRPRNYPETEEENGIAIINLLVKGPVIPRLTKNHEQEYEYLLKKSSPSMVVDQDEPESQEDKGQDEDDEKQEDVAMTQTDIKKNSLLQGIQELDSKISNFSVKSAKGNFTCLLEIDNIAEKELKPQISACLQALYQKMEEQLRENQLTQVKEVVKGAHVSLDRDTQNAVLLQCNYSKTKLSTVAVDSYIPVSETSSVIFTSDVKEKATFNMRTLVKLKEGKSLTWSERAIHKIARAWVGEDKNVTVFFVTTTTDDVLFKIKTVPELHRSTVVTINSVSSFLFSAAAYLLTTSEAGSNTVITEGWQTAGASNSFTEAYKKLFFTIALQGELIPFPAPSSIPQNYDENITKATKTTPAPVSPEAKDLLDKYAAQGVALEKLKKNKVDDAAIDAAQGVALEKLKKNKVDDAAIDAAKKGLLAVNAKYKELTGEDIPRAKKESGDIMNFDDIAEVLKDCASLTTVEDTVTTDNKSTAFNSNSRTAKCIQRFLHDLVSQNKSTKVEVTRYGDQVVGQDAKTIPIAMIVTITKSNSTKKSIFLISQTGSDLKPGIKGQEIFVSYATEEKFKAADAKKKERDILVTNANRNIIVTNDVFNNEPRNDIF